METLGRELVAATMMALELAVRLGLPVVVLFVMGFLAYRQEQQSSGPMTRGGSIGRRPASGERRANSSGAAAGAYSNPSGSAGECQQSSKEPSGALRAEGRQRVAFLTTNSVSNT